MDAAPMAPYRTEAASPERRRVIQIVQLLNLAFLAVDLALYGRNWPVLSGRLLVSAALLALHALLEADVLARPVRIGLWGCVLALVAGFAFLALGSGGAQSPYLQFLAFVPIVMTIVVPDEPSLTLVAGTAGTAVGMGFALGAKVSLGQIGFALAAFTSCTIYGTSSALLYRRMRRCQQAAALARAQALEELRRSEQRRLRAERLAAVGRLAAGVAHEVNNPLAFVGSNLRFVQSEIARQRPDPELSAALREAQTGLDRIRRIVADLHAFSREGSDQIEDTDVCGAVDEALRLAAGRLAAARVERCLPPQLPPARANPERLVQVIAALLENAADALAESGDQRLHREPRVRIEVSTQGEEVRVLVEDSGPGFAASVRERLFEPFVTTKAGGTGLALALCRELVEQWGGRIQADAAPGGGAQLSVALARAPS